MNKFSWTTIALISALSHSTVAVAISELEVNGSANIGSTQSSESDIETGDPLARTAISIGDSSPGIFEYSAAADITIPQLQIFGSLTNTGGALFSEVPLLAVNASLQDTITLTSASPDPYTVTAALTVNGILDVDGSNGRVVAQIEMDPVDQLAQSGFRTYSTNQTVSNDVLPISFNFVGDAEFDITSALFFFVTSIGAGTSVTADFSNTAIITLTITGSGASGVTVTSASGAFGTNPIPLPAALPLLLSALGALGFSNRFLRRAAPRKL